MSLKSDRLELGFSMFDNVVINGCYSINVDFVLIMTAAWIWLSVHQIISQILTVRNYFSMIVRLLAI